MYLVSIKAYQDFIDFLFKFLLPFQALIMTWTVDSLMMSYE
jgi:hypothetical protein